MPNVQGQKSEEQGVVARLGARTSNQASHEDKLVALPYFLSPGM